MVRARPQVSRKPLDDTGNRSRNVPDGRSGQERVDDHGRAYAGSQLQIQIYTSRRRPELTASVATALINTGVYLEDIRWVSPLEEERFGEVCDGAFLDALQLSHLRSPLAAFWPASGPRWDGLGILEPGPGVLLVEAKSYPNELIGSGCKAGSNSLNRIKDSLANAKVWAGVTPESDWLGPLYQYANRLAHVFFLRETGRVPAWLVNLCFLEDPNSPTSLRTWQQQLPSLKKQLGFAQKCAPFTVDVFLPARSRHELLGVV
jgi:hypothetical protein